ncbi:MAG: transposase [Verrucomicrobiota bacterium]|jgi:REP element-mobilizing transposase RayT
MARPIRIEYDGATYHVMARGNQGQAIFADDLDRRVWQETLAEACEKTGWRIHAWVMMGNHYHVLVETPEGNLVAGMKWFQGTYTQRYNSRHSVFGHLFQGRYKALVVDGAGGNYFGVVSTYIHLNPARAGLIKAGEEPLSRYRWSSYPWYMKARRQRPGWLITERVMGDLGMGPDDRKGYEAYMEGRALELGMKAGRKVLEEEWKRIRRGWYLGGDGFRGRMLKMLKATFGKGRAASYMGQAKRAHGEAEAERLLAQGLAVLGVLGVEGRQLEEHAKGMAEKRVLAWWLRQRTTAGRRWISERLWMGEESGVSKAIRQVKENRDAELNRLKKRLLKGLNDGRKNEKQAGA